MMLNFLDQIPYSVLIIFAIVMLLLPFRPMPHVMEKLIMLKNGVLNKPSDILDLFFHTAALLLLIVKLCRDYLK
ncbi:MAG: RND transporter [Desulfobacterales bacterium]|nr:MAG: RND transporter [Desulfobacterales bacterium]